MKSWKGVTQDKHLKLSDSTEFKLKTWNSSSGNKSWVSTSLGVSRKPLDTGLETGTDTATVQEKKNIIREDEIPKMAHIDIVDYSTRLKQLNSKCLKERRGDTNRLLSNDRTMLLHNERQRYDDLEADYQKLLLQVQKLQNSHALEMSSIKKKSSSSTRALGHALDLKSQETVELQRLVHEWQARYADESAKWIFNNEELKEKLMPLQNKIQEYQEIVEKRDSVIGILKEKLKQENSKYNMKEDELNRFIASFRRTESSFNKEREAWLDIKLELSEKNQALSRLQEENESLKLAQSKSNEAISDIKNVKPVLDEARKKIGFLLEREKGLLSDLESLTLANRKFLEKEQGLKENLKDLEKELLILKGNHGISLKEIESYKASNKELLELTYSLNQSREEEAFKINDLGAQIDSLKSKNIKLEEHSLGLTRLNQEYSRQITKLQKEVDYSKSSSVDYYKRIESLMLEKSNLSSTLSLVQQDLYDTSNRFQEVSELLQDEKNSKAELIQQNSSKFENITARINKLQSTIEETSKLLIEYKNNEINLRSALSERNDLLKEKELEVLQLRNTVSILKESLSSQSTEFQDLTESRKSQVLQLSDMYESDIGTLKSKISNLKTELDKKSKILNESTVKITNLKYENASLVSEISKLKSELLSCRASESNLNARINSLESVIKTFESQITIYKTKTKSLESQISVLEKASKISTSKIVFEPLNLGKLQEKLVDQLDSLVENQF